MKHLRHLTKQNGQALVELAIFGTVLLFCLSLLTSYGMGAIYKQNMKMQGFRKAFLRASSNDSATRPNTRIDPRWSYEHPDPGEPALPSNHWRQVTYTVLEDKPTVSVSGILPLSGRTSVGMSASALRSIDMFADLDYGVLADLPRIEYEINGRRYSFTTAAYKTVVEHDDMRIKEDIEDWDETGPCWEWKTISSVEEAMDDALKDADGDGYKEVFEMIDVDDDAHEEFVLDIKDNKGDGEDLIAQGEALIAQGEALIAQGEALRDGGEELIAEGEELIAEGEALIAQGEALIVQDNFLRLIDYQEGEFDSGIEEVGIEDDYIKRSKVGNSTFTRREDTTGITTIDDINTQDIFYRTIKLKEEEYYDVEDDLATKRKATWYTPH